MGSSRARWSSPSRSWCGLTARARWYELVDHLRAGRIEFSVGFDLNAEVRQAIIDLPEMPSSPGFTRGLPSWQTASVHAL